VGGIGWGACICQAKSPPSDLKHPPRPQTEKAKEPVENEAFQLAFVNSRWGNFQLKYPSKTGESIQSTKDRSYENREFTIDFRFANELQRIMEFVEINRQGEMAA